MTEREQKFLKDHEEVEPGQWLFAAVEEFPTAAKGWPHTILSIAATLWIEKG